MSEDRSPISLYAPAPQVDGCPDWDLAYEWVDPATAAQWLADSAQDDTFRNRPTNKADIARTAEVMRRKGFVHFLPNGPLCFDPNAVLLNGKTRLTALVEAGSTIGFIVFRGVPRWMFSYMDTGRAKTARGAFYASYKADQPGIIAAMKAVIRYEEVLAGIRSAEGWRHWRKQADQIADLERVYNLRQELVDMYGTAMAVRRGCKLTAQALMLFNFYQWHAWPEGRAKLEEFMDALREGANLKSRSAALALRNWGKEDYCPAEGRTEIQFILLIRHFAAFAQDQPLPRVTWAYGHPMPAPYHPDGDDAAKAELRAALPPLNPAIG